MLKKIVLIRMNLDLNDALGRLAEGRGSTISQVIREACIEHCKKSGIIFKSKKERR